MLLFTKDMKSFYSCYTGDDPFQKGWVFMQKEKFDKMFLNCEIVEKK
jgi:hypothetical protein